MAGRGVYENFAKFHGNSQQVFINREPIQGRVELINNVRLLSGQRRHVDLGAGRLYDRSFLGDMFSSAEARLVDAAPRQVLRARRVHGGRHQELGGVLDPRRRARSHQ